MQGEANAQPIVLVIGAGTVGTALLELIARQRIVDHIIVCDKDTVALHNIGKSLLFEPADVGKPKAVIAAERLRARAPGVTIVPVAGDVASLGLGLFLASTAVIVAADNRLAKFVANRACQAAGVAHLLIAEVEGDASLSCRLRRFSGLSGPCLEDAWSSQDYALLDTLSRPCARPQPAHPSLPFSPAFRLACDTAEEIQRCLLDRPSLPPGAELRWLPEPGRYLRLRIGERSDCLCEHGPRRPRHDLSGSALTYRLSDFVGDAERLLGPGWTWSLPDACMTIVCPACRAIPGWQRNGANHSVACPDCGTVLRRANCTRVITASDLEYGRSGERLMAQVWPAGDLLELTSARGERVFAALPQHDVLSWLACDQGGTQ